MRIELNTFDKNHEPILYVHCTKYVFWKIKKPMKYDVGKKIT